MKALKHIISIEIRTAFISMMFCLFFGMLTTTVFGQAAFPGAEGFGANSVGGRGGTVIKVTNLNDSGPGSFRAALIASYPRIVVFDVSGIINLESGINIYDPYLTIAGQTSPGGILITGYMTKVNTHDVIIRHMRFRVGSHRIADGADPETLDAFDIWGSYWGPNEAYNIIIDHSSFSWGVDETVTVTGGVTNTTIQWCIISEGLMNAGHPEGEHSKGLMVSGKYINPNSVSVHHNYIAHNTARSPLIYSPEGVEMTVDLVNNISYNWKGGLSPEIGGTAKTNWIHNYSKQGASSNSYSFELQYSNRVSPAVPLIYVNGNIGSTRLNQSDPQWNVGVDWHDVLLFESFRQLTPWMAPSVTTTIMSYDYALEILTDVGATKPIRDDVDTRVTNDFINTTGDRIDNIIYPDEFPTFQNLSAPADTDNDGMPDIWETENGLNANDPADYNGTVLSAEGYTNIEMYINELADFSLNTSIIKQHSENDQEKIILVNYPNPFNPYTTIKYFVATTSDVQLRIYNQLGQEVYMLVNEQKPAGEHQVNWDGKDAKGDILPNGIYLCRLTAGEQSISKNMLYLQ
jgi:flagellar hook capping protein FlgD